MSLLQANYCNSWLVDCTQSDPRFLSTNAFSIKTSFSISAFVDIGTANNGIFLPNTEAGIVIVDATRNFIVLYCGMVTWNGNTYRECKGYNDTNLVGAPSGFVPGEAANDAGMG